MMLAAVLIGSTVGAWADNTYTVSSTSDLSDGKAESIEGLTITYHGSWSYSTDRLSGVARSSTNINENLTAMTI